MRGLRMGMLSAKKNIFTWAKGSRNYIEYKRLKRIRKQNIPAYTHCMNCGDELKGMYCSKCGQYALDINQGFFSYIKQFLENTYQFDGKIMQTVKHLAINPGFLTTEFTKGKINSYVHPMKLYMFMSVLFFSFVFGFFADNSINSSLIAIEDSSSKTENADVDAKKKKALVYIVNESENKPQTENQDLTAENEDTGGWFKGLDSLDKINGSDVAQKNRVVWSLLNMLDKYIPLILLLLIPIFGGILKMFFRKSQSSYMNNVVFAFHIHSFFLLNICLLLVADAFIDMDLSIIFFSVFVIYSILSARFFYRQSWFKSIFKMLTGMGIYFVVVVIFMIMLVVLILNKIGTDLGHGLY